MGRKVALCLMLFRLHQVVQVVSASLCETSLSDNEVLNVTLECNDHVEVLYSYSGSVSFRDSITLDVACTNAAGEDIKSELLANRESFYPNNDDSPYVYDFSEPGSNCTVYGCYQVDDILYNIMSASCTFKESDTTTTGVTPTAVTSVITTSIDEAVTTSIVEAVSSVVMTSESVKDTTASNDLPTILSTSVQINVPITPSPVMISRTHSITADNQRTFSTLTVSPTMIVPGVDAIPLEGIVMVSVFLVIIILVFFLLLVSLLFLLMKAYKIYRLKHSRFYYTNPLEEIDPYFNPIDIHSEVKAAVSIISVFDVLASYSSNKLQCKVKIIDEDTKSTISQTTKASEDNFSANFTKLDADELENPTYNDMSIEGKEVEVVLSSENSSPDPVQNKEDLEEREILAVSPAVVDQLDRGDNVLSRESSKQEITLLSESNNIKCLPNHFDNGYLLENSGYQMSVPNHVQRMSEPLGNNSSKMYVTTPGISETLSLEEISVCSESEMQASTLPSQSYERVLHNMQEFIRRGYQVPYVPHPSHQTIALDDPIDFTEENIEDYPGHEQDTYNFKWDGQESEMVSDNSLSECSFSINPLHFEHTDFVDGYQQCNQYVANT